MARNDETTVQYDNGISISTVINVNTGAPSLSSVTINIDGGARGEGDSYDTRAGFSGSVGKVFMNGVEV